MCDENQTPSQALHLRNERDRLAGTLKLVPCVSCVYHRLISLQLHLASSTHTHIYTNKCSATTEKKSHDFRFAFISFVLFSLSPSPLFSLVVFFLHYFFLFGWNFAYTTKTIQFRRQEKWMCEHFFPKEGGKARTDMRFALCPLQIDDGKR